MRNKNKYTFGKDRVGEKYNDIEIIEFIPKEVETDSESYFLIKCVCGNVFPRLQSHYDRIIKLKSCGCKPAIEEDDAWKRIHKQWIYGITKRRKEYHQSFLTIDQFKMLSLGDCYYCGIYPARDTRIRGYYINGIDRIDNNIDYEFSNCRSCCTSCNFSKHIKSEEEFYLMCHAVARLHPEWAETPNRPIIRTPSSIDNPRYPIQANNLPNPNIPEIKTQKSPDPIE